MAQISNKEDQHNLKHSKETEDWAAEVEEKLKKMAQCSTETSKWQKRAIFKVPAYIKNRNPKAYSPQMVSLGPYHHGEIHLKPMEEHKQRALLHYLQRSNKSPQVLYESFYKEVEDLKDSYDQLDDQWNKDKTKEFLELMILDGCFMLDIFRASNTYYADHERLDPIFGFYGMLSNSPCIRRDMLMLENQLPMRVLEILCAESDNHENLDRLLKYFLKFFFQSYAFPVEGSKKYLHVLDLYRSSLVFRSYKRPRSALRVRWANNDAKNMIRSATQLNEAGIQFEGLNVAGFGFGTISFLKGVLKLPVISLDDGTESMFLNIIALERLRMGTGTEVTSYLLFMDNLIDNERDVAVLHSKGIIQNMIGSDKAVAELFNSLSKDLIVEPDDRIFFVRRNVNKYCEKRWNEWRANLTHTYFRNPWVTLSFIAAFLLFTLTILQTTYTILPYYRT